MTSEGWKTKGAAEKYKQTVDIVAPGRQEILSMIARLAARTIADKPYIMDIGCGWGNVTDEILAYKPQASVNMVDYSEEMVCICQEKFKDNPNIQVMQYDLNQGLPSLDIKFDSVVSCFALHHIEFENRIKLYTDIRKTLKDEGVFVNGDLFKGDSPAMNQWEFNNYIYWMVEQLKEKLGQTFEFSDLKTRQLENYKIMRDMPGTIWDMCSDLKKSGFQFVDCLCKYQNLAVLAASSS
jgi:cyclopropane fatty-acyl-phospholipid synthase-like methyltransferase